MYSKHGPFCFSFLLQFVCYSGVLPNGDCFFHCEFIYNAPGSM